MVPRCDFRPVRVIRVDSATGMRRFFRPASCKQKQASVWRPIWSCTGLSSYRSHVIRALQARIWSLPLCEFLFIILRWKCLLSTGLWNAKGHKLPKPIQGRNIRERILIVIKTIIRNCVRQRTKENFPPTWIQAKTFSYVWERFGKSAGKQCFLQLRCKGFVARHASERSHSKEGSTKGDNRMIIEKSFSNKITNGTTFCLLSKNIVFFVAFLFQPFTNLVFGVCILQKPSSKLSRKLRKKLWSNMYEWKSAFLMRTETNFKLIWIKCTRGGGGYSPI